MGLGTGATAAIIGGIGAAGSAASSAIGANAAGNAASAQTNAANYAANLQAQEAQNALNFQEQQYNQGQQNLAPWLRSGTGALSQLDYLEGITPQSPTTYPVGGTPAVPNSILNGSPASTTGRPSAPGIGGATPVSNLPLTNRPTSTLARVGTNGQPGRPSSPLGYGGVLNPGTGPSTPLSSLSGSPASVTVPNGIDPATGFQTGAGGGFGSLNQGWNREFQAPTAAQAAATPGYQFALQQGENAIQNSAAAKGGLLSGNTLQALDQYSQGLADTNYQQTYNNALQQYQNAYNQFQQNQQNQFNRLGSLAGVGQTAAGQLNSAGQAAANNIGNISQTAGQQIGQSAQNAGAATASGYVGQANAINGGISGVGNSLQQGLLLNSLVGGGGGPSATNVGYDPSYTASGGTYWG